MTMVCICSLKDRQSELSVYEIEKQKCCGELVLQTRVLDMITLTKKCVLSFKKIDKD